MEEALLQAPRYKIMEELAKALIQGMNKNYYCAQSCASVWDCACCA